MKKYLLICLTALILFSSTVFAGDVKAKVEKISENSINIIVSSDSKIKVTGYTISNGSDIIVYYTKDNKGAVSDSITINLNTVLKPYKVILSDSENSPSFQPFSDIKDSSFKNYIRHLYDFGYVNGYEGDSTFRPNNSISRAEFITLLVRTLNLNKKSNQEVLFDDINSSNWAYENIQIAAQHGIVEGYFENGKRSFKPDNNIKISEAVKAIDSAFCINNTSSLNYDTRFINHWAKANIQSLLNTNIISAVDDFYKKGEIDRFANRGEVAMLISRTLGR